MSDFRFPPPQSRRTRSSAGRRLVRVLAAASLAAVCFALGLALGQSLEDNPEPGRRTDVRTLRPVSLPAERETVTVTVTTP